jgi:hypothetical protein
MTGFFNVSEPMRVVGSISANEPCPYEVLQRPPDPLRPQR